MSVSITPENEIKRIRIKASYFFNNTLLYGNMLCEYIQRTKLEDFVKEQLIEWVRTYLISVRSNDFRANRQPDFHPNRRPSRAYVRGRY